MTSPTGLGTVLWTGAGTRGNDCADVGLGLGTPWWHPSSWSSLHLSFHSWWGRENGG